MALNIVNAFHVSFFSIIVYKWIDIYGPPYTNRLPLILLYDNVNDFREVFLSWFEPLHIERKYAFERVHINFPRLSGLGSCLFSECNMFRHTLYTTREKIRNHGLASQRQIIILAYFGYHSKDRTGMTVQKRVLPSLVLIINYFKLPLLCCRVFITIFFFLFFLHLWY